MSTDPKEPMVVQVSVGDLTRRDLKIADEALRAGRPRTAEEALNRVAATYRALGLKNRNAKYRELSSGCVELRIDGAWRPGEDD